MMNPALYFLLGHTVIPAEDVLPMFEFEMLRSRVDRCVHQLGDRLSLPDRRGLVAVAGLAVTLGPLAGLSLLGDDDGGQDVEASDTNGSSVSISAPPADTTSELEALGFTLDDGAADPEDQDGPPTVDPPVVAPGPTGDDSAADDLATPTTGASSTDSVASTGSTSSAVGGTDTTTVRLPSPSGTTPTSNGATSSTSGAASSTSTTEGTSTSSSRSTTSTSQVLTTTTTTTTSTTVAPRPGGWPGPGNTGVRAGVTLTPSGSITVNQDGAVISNLEVRGTIYVNADNVTIRNVRVIAQNPGDLMINVGYDHSGILIEDCEIDGRGIAFRGVGFDGYTMRRCDVHHVGHGAVTERNVVVEDNYIHDLVEGPSGDWHTDGIIMSIGHNVVIRHNSISNPLTQTSAIGIWAEIGNINDVLVENNLLSGGGFVVYALDQGFTMSNVRFRDNWISTRDWRSGTTGGPGGGYYGVWYPDFARGASESGTIWYETGAGVDAP